MPPSTHHQCNHQVVPPPSLSILTSVVGPLLVQNSMTALLASDRIVSLEHHLGRTVGTQVLDGVRLVIGDAGGRSRQVLRVQRGRKRFLVHDAMCVCVCVL